MPQRMFAQIHATLCSYFQFLFPMLASLGDGAAKAAERLDDRLRWFVAIMSGFAYTGLALAGPLLLTHLVSPEFAERASVPLFLACLQGFIHAQMIVPYFSSWAAGQGRPNAMMSLLHGLLVIPAAVCLIPRFGCVGASIAQLCILPVVIVHSIWVCRILLSQKVSWRWLSWLTSPCVMIGVWLLVVKGCGAFLPSHTVSLLCLMLIGALAGFGAVACVEHFVFPAQHRWQTLLRAFGLLADTIRQRLSIKQKISTNLQ
jgi:O-antigen/teichoic acid export membrane protein